MSRRGSLHDFNPRNTGLYEANVWKAYYDRDWPLALLLVYRMLRSQFNLGLVQGVWATYYSVRAAVAWVPRDHDIEKVRALLRRFYGVLRAAAGAPFDAEAAGDAELDYWAIHRQFDGEKGRPELIDANARIAATVYSLSFAQARPAGVARAHAADLVDDITGGRQAPTPEAWATVAAALRSAYTLLHDAAAVTAQQSRVIV